MQQPPPGTGLFGGAGVSLDAGLAVACPLLQALQPPGQRLHPPGVLPAQGARLHLQAPQLGRLLAPGAAVCPGGDTAARHRVPGGLQVPPAPAEERDPGLRHQEGKGATAMILRDLQHTRGWDPVEDPWVPRRSLSFLTEDDTESSVTSGVPNDVPEPLSSTHKSLLEELGGGCDSGDPLLCPAGDVTPWGLEPPRHLHVTPRTRSRLQASAQRLGASSSSSLFDETLEMPRRPPRIRAPRGVPRDPVTTSGHCDTLGGEDVSSGDREGTGSLDDTEILPRPPSQTSSPGSSPTVLLVPGDTAHPQGTPGDAQGSPGSSPTVLLVPGDTAHPQDTPRDAQGSPGSSPMVLLVPGDTGNPQDTPRDAQGSPCAAGSPPNLRMLQGGFGLHDPPPLGTHRPLQPHGSSICLWAPQPPSASLSPTGYSTHCTGEHPKDEEGDQAPTECHSPSTEATSSSEDTVVRDERGCRVLPHPLSDESLRRRLRVLGDNPGPVTEFTRRLYLRRLEQLARGHQGTRAGHSPELVAALRSGHIPNCAQDELVLAQQFDRPDRSRRWREGLLKSSFNYLLLDPRITQNLPLRSHQLSPAECFRTFVKSIFYVGKGTRARPYRHFTEALSQHRAGTQRGCPKVRRILEIWASGHGVVSVLCFQNCVPAEAYTRESCIVEALGLQTITNQRKGNCYGAAASWPAAQRRRLGVHMLHRALRIFLAEGERQLRPHDIPGGARGHPLPAPPLCHGQKGGCAPGVVFKS
ncbi:ankyrin repeat and LEM domain-containing protein 1 isoform A [Patagioenas fasciata monilis]|uniref:Ankyrin repeat and LEM domain-containing protein 1 isoform A n=1 Tax=Patagioenas fasciata monilis TaxID=372326 RepID=A0A1V4KQE7_PATFA|nr:ankyrin repeat and LEM domain-containing protein 1 isoform A [Patagioenas fasciata monilis]